MDENISPEKPNIQTRCWCFVKDQCFDLGIFFKIWFCYVLNKSTGNKCEDRNVATLFIGLGCFYFISSGVAFNIGLLLPNPSEITNELSGTEYILPQVAGVVLSDTDIKIEPPKKDVAEAASRCNLNEGNWVRWLGKINQDFEDKNHFVLPTNSSGALFKFIGKIDDFSSCEFTFIPRSESSINYTLSLDEIYQIVIGDNNFWTITLSAADSIGGDFVPVKEQQTQKTRPRLLNSIKNGTTVKVTLNQIFLDSGKYKVDLIVMYRPDIDSSDELKTEILTWIFEPSPAILENPSLSLGLIRGDDDKSEIGINFVNPSMIKKEDIIIDSN